VTVNTWGQVRSAPGNDCIGSPSVLMFYVICKSFHICNL